MGETVITKKLTIVLFCQPLLKKIIVCTVYLYNLSDLAISVNNVLNFQKICIKHILGTCAMACHTAKRVEYKGESPTTERVVF